MHIRAPVRNDQEGNGSGLLSTQEHEESKWGEKQHRGSVFYSVFGVRDFFVEKRIVPGTLCAKNESGNETRGIVFGRSGGAGAEPPQNLSTAAAVVQTEVGKDMKCGLLSAGTLVSNLIDKFKLIY